MLPALLGPLLEARLPLEAGGPAAVAAAAPAMLEGGDPHHLARCLALLVRLSALPAVRLALCAPPPQQQMAAAVPAPLRALLGWLRAGGLGAWPVLRRARAPLRALRAGPSARAASRATLPVAEAAHGSRRDGGGADGGDGSLLLAPVENLQVGLCQNLSTDFQA